MITTAIICEFNPIHTGHKKLLDYAKTFSDKVICIMSGNFVQRGMPSCCDKYSRAKHAVLCGADLVVELPIAFCTASATDFALGGVMVANALNVDYLLFGSECGNIEQLKDCTKKLLDATTNENIKKQIQLGNSYPKAVQLATNIDLLSNPNDTLALEYIKALTVTNSTIVAKTIKRENNYNGTTVDGYASSSAIRSDLSLINEYSFPFVQQDICPQIEDNYKDFATHYLTLLNTTQIEQIDGVSEGLQNKIVQADKSNGYDKMIEQIKSKRYTQAKIQRIVLHCVLGITKQYKSNCIANGVCVNVLAVSNNSTCLLQNVENATVDEVTKNADNLYYSLGGKKPPKKLQKI